MHTPVTISCPETCNVVGPGDDGGLARVIGVAGGRLRRCGAGSLFCAYVLRQSLNRRLHRPPQAHKPTHSLLTCSTSHNHYHLHATSSSDTRSEPPPAPCRMSLAHIILRIRELPGTSSTPSSQVDCGCYIWIQKLNRGSISLSCHEDLRSLRNEAQNRRSDVAVAVRATASVASVVLI